MDDYVPFVPRFLMCPIVKIGWSFNGLWTEVGHIMVHACWHWVFLVLGER